MPRPRLSILEIFLDAPLLILAGGAALLLGVGCQNGEHQFSVRAHGADVLFLEVNIHPQRFQIPDSLEQHHRVPGEPGDRLCDDEVYFSGNFDTTKTRYSARKVAKIKGVPVWKSFSCFQFSLKNHQYTYRVSPAMSLGYSPFNELSL